MRITVINVSDKVFQGAVDDVFSKEAIQILKQQFQEFEVHRVLVPANKDAFLNALEHNKLSDFIITIGCTGLSEKDIVPEITKDFCEKDLPGISEIMRVEGYRDHVTAMLSRNYAGIKGKTIIINLPGHLKAIKHCIRYLMPIMKPAKQLLNGQEIDYSAE